ncbi:protein TALPID3 isoform X3 [Latimeria chalumnae]|uniref:protein TALPID3 isoform X3 n=1 Tax=Latimeria chalumnae TaxID=7897 RepID=UPI0003C1031F|nr:PREDICTED: protein TALPID3 isoform X3 [Latimeria chalumnae]|eukprot:XP_005986497.1 PREDICTED: protein TALPID3 isoform X3 [Latimeria chalumnae]
MDAGGRQPGAVRISLKKLREVPSSRPANGPAEEARALGSVRIPPALPANQPAASGSSAPRTAFPDGAARGTLAVRVNAFADRKSEQQLPWEEGEGEYFSTSQRVLNRDFKSHIMNPSSSNGPAEGSRQKESDILVSQYSVGQKEALRAAFKLRAQSEQVRKEVKVQFLKNHGAEQKEMEAQGSRTTECNLDSARAAAAATAAAITATAPLIKAQNNLEAKVDAVSELVSKLQEADKQIGLVAEQQVKAQAEQTEKPHQQKRICELEKQLSTLMEQRIQHLEKLQHQQLALQSCIMNSVVGSSSHQVSAPSAYSHSMQHNSVTEPTSKQGLQQLPSNNIHYSPLGDVPSAVSRAQPERHQIQHRNGTSVEKSPLETPAPRKYAPAPMSKDVGVPKEKFVGRSKANRSTSIATGNGRFLEKILDNQETPVRQTESVQKTGVTMATTGRPSESSSSGVLQNESFSALGGLSRGIELVEGTNGAAVQKATDVLHDLGQLKKDMHGILQEAANWRCQMKDFNKQSTNSNTSSSRRTIDPTPSWHPPATNITRATDPPKTPKLSLLQTVQAPASMFEDAGRILQEVQNNKKVLEENLEAIIHANDGAAMYSLISALSANRDAVEEVRIRKTVDAWIGAISKDLQVEIAKKDFLNQLKSKEKEPESPLIKKEQSKKEMRINKDIKATAQNKQVGPNLRSQSIAKPQQKWREETSGKQILKSRSIMQPLEKKTQRSKLTPKVNESLLEDEAYLSRVYGKAVYEGHRGTLKKGPYLRFNSPAAKAKLQRPKVVESVRGVKLKSARTQTSPLPLKVVPMRPGKQRPLSVPACDGHYIFSPSREVPSNSPISGPVEGHLIPMAIPLGQPRIDSVGPKPSNMIITSAPQPITVTTCIPPSPSKSQTNIKKPNIAVIEMKSEKKDIPKLSIQVLPNVDIDSISSSSPVSSCKSPSPEPQLSVPLLAQTLIQAPEPMQSEEVEDVAFPGADFIAVTDVTEEPDKEDELPEFLESAIELDGYTGSMTVNYHGPRFPPSAPAPQPTVDIVDKMIAQRETLENKLIDWVEQEIMACVINKMYPVHQELIPEVNVSESEESVGLDSDIVEAAGGGGLQLFVDAGMPVNSDLIRQYVNEALAEIVAIMLGQRESQTGTAPVESGRTSSPEAIVPTPVVTPQSTPPHTPPPVKEPFPIKTPVRSPENSVVESMQSEQEQPTTLVQPEPADSEPPTVVNPVVTPTSTPVTTPPRVVTPTPPVSEKIKTPSPEPPKELPDPWEGAELPLDEENPSTVRETVFPSRPIVMSVAKDEEPGSLILAPPTVVVRANPPPHETPPPFAAHSPIPTPSTEESSSTISVTETETVDRPISEGEVLFSYGQVAAARALAEGGVSLFHLNASLASTLHDAEEMDHDPPSEGQVIKRSHRGHHRDPVLSLLTKMNQPPFAPQEVRYHPENSEEDNSIGEISEGQRPRLTTAAESTLTGHSLYMDKPAVNGLINEQRKRPPTSPGEFHKYPEVVTGNSDASHGPMSLGELESQPVPVPRTRQVTVTSSRIPATEDGAQNFEVTRTEHKPAPVRLIQVGSKPEDPRQSGAEASSSLNPQTPYRKMSVMLPSMNVEDQSDSICTIGDDTDTSGADIF